TLFRSLLGLLQLGLGPLNLGRELAFALGGLPGVLELGLGRGHVLLGLRRLRSPRGIADAQSDDDGDDPDHDGLHGASRSWSARLRITSCPWISAPASARASPFPWP